MTEREAERGAGGKSLEPSRPPPPTSNNLVMPNLMHPTCTDAIRRGYYRLQPMDPSRAASKKVSRGGATKMSRSDSRVHSVGQEDELETYLSRAQQDPVFRAAYEDADERHSIIDRLVALRRLRRLSQTAVAARMGVRQPTVSGFETEDSDPRLSTLQRYARAVGARLRVVLVIPSTCDWISSSAGAYLGASPSGTAGASVREGELAEEWRAEKQAGHVKSWAISA
jgi:transcriptional regulator with XRE-family HTH domain